jgi:hypothetical protein
MNDPLPVLPIDQQASSSHQQYQQGGLLQQQSFPSGGYPLFEFESTFDDIGHPKPSKVRRGLPSTHLFHYF